MGSIFHEELRDFINYLNKYKVRYILIGGYSVIIHGYPRTTGDLDIWVDVNLENYQNLVKSFNEAFKKANYIMPDGLKIMVINYNHLIQAKRYPEGQKTLTI